MQQRYYDPGIGRFLSVDPVTANGNTGANFNRYWYANNNPYRFKDPDGRKCSTVDGKASCTFDEFGKDKKGNAISREQALSSGGKLAKIFGADRGSHILRAEAQMTAKYTAAKALAAKGQDVTIPGDAALGVPAQNVSASTIVNNMESMVVVGAEGNSPKDQNGIRYEADVPATGTGAPSNGPIRFWRDGSTTDVGRTFGHEALHGAYSGVGVPNFGWANPSYQQQHQAPFDEASDEIK